MNDYITTQDLFNDVIDKLKDNGEWPEVIVEYGLPGYLSEPLWTTELDIVSKLDYGPSEGIYLDLYVRFFDSGEQRTLELGSIKTLEESKEAFESFGKLLGDFVFEGRKYIRKHYDELDRTGFAERGVMADGIEGHYLLLAGDYDAAVARVSEVFAANNKRSVNEQFVAAKIINKRTKEEELIKDNQMQQMTVRRHKGR